jgi:digeranylgeranylglycerophospholipid reductase
MRMKCDVLVVGAGPAGSSAAYACAKAGLRTILIERKKELGVPVSCSGAIGGYLLPFLPFKLPKRFLEYKIEGLEFFVEDISFTRKGGPWTSYAIDRSSCDKWLGERARDSGAELFLNTELIGLRFDDENSVKSGLIKRNGDTGSIEFTILIGADGAESTVLEELGQRKRGARIGRAMVYEFKDVDLVSPSLDHVYFGDFAPGGYAHLFPVSKDRANVGVGTIVKNADVNGCFEKFLSLPAIRSQLKGAKRVREKSGIVSFDRLSNNRHYGNVLLAGEAGSQNIKPLVEGYLPSIICGDIAGKTAANNLINEEPVENYQPNLDRKMGAIFRESDKLISILEDLSDLKSGTGYLLLAGLSSNILSINDISELMEEDAGEIKRKLDSFNRSWWRRIFLNFSERTLISLLQAQMRANSKLYKL